MESWLAETDEINSHEKCLCRGQDPVTFMKPWNSPPPPPHTHTHTPTPTLFPTFLLEQTFLTSFSRAKATSIWLFSNLGRAQWQQPSTPVPGSSPPHPAEAGEAKGRRRGEPPGPAQHFQYEGVRQGADPWSARCPAGPRR